MTVTFGTCIALIRHAVMWIARSPLLGLAPDDLHFWSIATFVIMLAMDALLLLIILVAGLAIEQGLNEHYNQIRKL